jgi:hypothetical protein
LNKEINDEFSSILLGDVRISAMPRRHEASKVGFIQLRGKKRRNPVVCAILGEKY